MVKLKNILTGKIVLCKDKAHAARLSDAMKRLRGKNVMEAIEKKPEKPQEKSQKDA
jgi:hypothetical protein